MTEEDMFDQEFGTYGNYKIPMTPVKPVKRSIGVILYNNAQELFTIFFVLLILFFIVFLYIHRNDPKPEKVVEVLIPKSYTEICIDGVSLISIIPEYGGSNATVIYKRDLNDKLIACNKGKKL